MGEGNGVDEGVAVGNAETLECHQKTRHGFGLGLGFGFGFSPGFWLGFDFGLGFGDCRLDDILGSRRGLLNHLVSPGGGFRGPQRNVKEQLSIIIVELIEQCMAEGVLFTQLECPR